MSWRRWLLVGILVWMGAAPGQGASPSPAAPPSKAERLKLGERMYREGILPSGEPMQGYVFGDVPVLGTAFSCTSCHVRSGLGSFEGSIVTLPTNGARLRQPRYWKFPNLSEEERKLLSLQQEPVRPAYTKESLAKVLGTGVDPAGRELNNAMPRYALSDADASILVDYLWQLSSVPPPGVTAHTLRFATIVTDDVSPEDREAMLVPIRTFMERHNVHDKGFANRMYLTVGGQEMSGSYRKLQLSVWDLKGDPKTWPAQLEHYLQKDPVFALIGGLSGRPWTPIHTFCEQHRLPCLLPLTDLPVVSKTDWYTQYFSKGYAQEGETAARFLAKKKDLPAQTAVIQVVDGSPEADALAQGFMGAWDSRKGPVKTVRIKSDEAFTSQGFKRWVRRSPASVVLYWGKTLPKPLLASVDAQGGPTIIFLSSRRMGLEALGGVPEAARSRVWITHPYRSPEDNAAYMPIASTLLKGAKPAHPERRIHTRTYAMLEVLTGALMEMDRNVYRDNFLDRLGMLADHGHLPDYVRLSFGPGQRFASKGCFIAQVGPGPNPSLVPRSDWVLR